MKWENITGNGGKILPGDGKILPKHGKILPPNKVMNKVFKKGLRRARNKFHTALIIKIKNCRVTGFCLPLGDTTSITFAESIMRPIGRVMSKCDIKHGSRTD